MKSLLFVAFLLLSQHSGSQTPKVGPAPVVAGFNTDFTLSYPREARLPSRTKPELVVAVANVQCNFCPPNAQCLLADFASPVLRITDAKGRAQTVALAFPRPRAYRRPGLLDSTDILANGRRYVLYYSGWQLRHPRSAHQGAVPRKEDVLMVLHLATAR